MSNDEGSGTARENDAVDDSDDEASSLRDTAPGVVPEMELSRTLPTGAAFHATWRIPNLAAPSHDPGQESGVHAVERSSAAGSGSDTSADSTGSSAFSVMPNPPNSPRTSRASDAA